MKKEYDILVIDDEQVVIDAIVKICSSEGYTVDASIDAKDALAKLDSSRNYKLIICDIMMPVIDGFAFLNQLQARRISSPVIMTTGYATVENAVKSLYAGAIDFIPKPFTEDELANSVLRGMRFIKIQNLSAVPASGAADLAGSEISYVPCPAKYYRLGYISWASEENNGSFLIGVTDLFIRTVENVSEIELMQIENEVIQGNSCGYLADKEGRMHPILSPVSGKIIEVNEKLKKNKSIIEKDPYFEGWLYRLIPSDGEYEVKNLINCSSDRL